ncbi:conserved hypothetical protein [Theileria orientalis strain Shintoku]|uniref:Uncharacterized protein n=1 Tax=Theileria orientalis strain Shintoku TaxID=869250 RepID=J4C4H9_THEOR|nr:conserved hypothetical protein [Theileria orientalis strain Shintoku]BAM42216.1 conserved hypothetical protein [Theileria orientalis strain Shintoku]|eukprot:XP_009692517.1 conserved hypothetical protein [Theileria orientalis strain Shintoku]
MELKLESYGFADDRVLRYLNGAIIKETPVQHYFTLKNTRQNEIKKEGEEEKVEVDDKFISELDRVNCSNWNLPASTICMASTMSMQKEFPLEWDESKVDQINGYNTLTKIKGIFDSLENKKLQLSHTVNRQESKTLKYSIFNRNEKLEELSEKSAQMAEKLMKSLSLQLKYLEIIKEIKKEFKVLASHRNPVDLSTLDVDYPTSFSINVLFYDVAYHVVKTGLFNYNIFTQFEEREVTKYDMEWNEQENVWELWEGHGASPFSPQMGLISYYEGEELLTRLTFPQSISQFVEENYMLSINGSEAPLYTDTTNKIMYHLRRARACLIDRFIYCVLCQYCYSSVKLGRYFLKIGDSRVFIKYITSETLYLVCEGVDVEVSYRPGGSEEAGEPMWKLLVAKLRDLHVQNWKRQRFMLSNKVDNLLGEFLKYTIKLIRYKNRLNNGG